MALHSLILFLLNFFLVTLLTSSSFMALCIPCFRVALCPGPMWSAFLSVPEKAGTVSYLLLVSDSRGSLIQLKPGIEVAQDQNQDFCVCLRDMNSILWTAFLMIFVTHFLSNFKRLWVLWLQCCLPTILTNKHLLRTDIHSNTPFIIFSLKCKNTFIYKQPY